MKGIPAVPLGELVTVTGGGTPSRNQDAYYGGSIPWVTPKDMRSWEIADSKVRITDLGLRESSTKLIPADSVLVVVRSGVLKHSLPVAINRVPVALNQDMKALSPDGQIFPEYLAHFLRAMSPAILSWVRATTADNLPVEKLRALLVPLPAVSEQRRIADILDQADSARAKRQESITQVDDLARSIFLDMFGTINQATGRWVNVTDLVATGDALRTGPFGSQLLHSEFQNEGVAVRQQPFGL